MMHNCSVDCSYGPVIARGLYLFGEGIEVIERSSGSWLTLDQVDQDEVILLSKSLALSAIKDRQAMHKVCTVLLVYKGSRRDPFAKTSPEVCVQKLVEQLPNNAGERSQRYLFSSIHTSSS